MTAMTLVGTALRGGPLTRADLDRMPEDGRRYELIDGVLIVSPSPLHAISEPPSDWPRFWRSPALMIWRC